jgi:5-methylthioadenosine/S-adenosylhomocysteine deaminase
MNDKFVIRGAQIVTMDETIGELGSGDILVENGEIRSVAASIDAHGADHLADESARYRHRHRRW